MLHRFFDSFRSANRTSGFEAYYTNVQKRGTPGAPSLEEAQQDYQRLTRSASYWFSFPA